MRIETEEFVIEYEDDTITRDLLFNKMVYFFITNKAFNGESIVQSDLPQIEAPNLLADIADDIFKFKVTFKD